MTKEPRDHRVRVVAGRQCVGLDVVRSKPAGLSLAGVALQEIHGVDRDGVAAHGVLGLHYWAV